MSNIWKFAYLSMRKSECVFLVYTDSLRSRPGPLPSGSELDSTGPMIQPGFLDCVSRQVLIALARDGSAAHRLARRENALVLLNQGMSCEAIATVVEEHFGDPLQSTLDNDTTLNGRMVPQTGGETAR